MGQCRRSYFEPILLSVHIGTRLGWSFSLLTQELVARLNFGSASAQAAPPLLPVLTTMCYNCTLLLTLLLIFCPGAAQGT